LPTNKLLDEKFPVIFCPQIIHGKNCKKGKKEMAQKMRLKINKFSNNCLSDLRIILSGKISCR